MRSIETLIDTPFFQMTPEEKKAIVAHYDAKVTTTTDARGASIAHMISTTMKKAR